MNDDTVLLLGAIALAGIGLFALQKPLGNVTEGVGDIGSGAGSILGGIGEQGLLGWLIPDSIERLWN